MDPVGANRGGRRIGIILGLIVLVLAVSGGIAEFYTDLLWFDDLGQASVFWTRITAQWTTGLVAFVVAIAIVFVNLVIAKKMAPRTILTTTDDIAYRFEAFVQPLRAAIERYASAGMALAASIVALITAVGMAGQWSVFRLALEAVPFGKVDPQFGRDISFFFFTLPALSAVSGWLTGVLILTLLLTAAVHVLTGAIRPWARLAGFDPHVKAHLSVLAGLLVLLQAFNYWLDIYELDFSPRGTVVGASYTDIHAQLPAYTILIGVAILVGVALIVNVRFRGWRLPAVALGVWIAASVLIGGAYPAVVQQFRVSPNEAEAEAPYIERNIAMTRAAFGLDTIDVRAFPAQESLTASAVAGNAETIDNVRLWDPSIAVQTYQQLQGIRPYYDFIDVDVDRYTIGGTRRQVLISTRELNSEKLAEQARTWVNQHLVYTHGYGVVVSPVSEASGQGLPNFIVKDIPPVSSTDVAVEQPAIYFGELTKDYVIAATDIEEFDYPVGDQNANTTYAGATGIEMGGLLRRVAFALRFQAPQLLFSSYIRADSKVLFQRSIIERLDQLAPWLAFDDDPYVTIADGRLVWVIDGYSVSDRYPYSERLATFGGINYIRNSVKATVDAYDGTTTLYAMDETDPLLATWRAVFPGLVVDGETMPESIRAHLRYPEDLFRAQAESYKTYHMQDPRVFYNKEDQWELPGEAGEGGTSMTPFYVLMNLPGEATQDFMLMLPFTPRNKDNMIGWMSASSDPGSYGRRIVYTFPKQKLILGPEQVIARINQDPLISQQLTLWNQRGSGVLFGNMLVIPIDDAIVYVQPLYLQASKTAMPQLTRVAVAYGDSVTMQPDLASALFAIFGESEGVPTPGTGAAATAADAQDLYVKALEAQKGGDWAAYGRYVEELGAVLELLAGSESTVTVPTP